jgi:hypothetical protein
MAEMKRPRRGGQTATGANVNAQTYCRLSRYDCSGLRWLLNGREVVMLTADTATIRNPYTSNMTVYLKRNKPALGPLGDSLDDLQ